MQNTPNTTPTFSSSLLCLALAAGLALPLPAVAASVALATAPLATSTTASVKPNVMFILDDSGSMDRNFLPDWADDNNPFTGSNYTSQPELLRNNKFNGVAYNPAITYKKPVYFNADGSLNTTTYPNFGSPWTAVKNDGYGIQSTSTSNLLATSYYYTFTPGEHCSTPAQTSCAVTAVPTVANPYPAYVRWCDSAALTNCRSINDTTYDYPRYPGLSIPAKATVKVTFSSNSPLKTVTQITVLGQNIMKAAATGSTTESTTATSIKNQINACTAPSSGGNCGAAGGFSATVSSTTVTIYAPGSMGSITDLPVKFGTASTTITPFVGGLFVPGSNTITNIISTTPTYTKASTRSDCAGAASCTYIEEMTNHANWWAYYRTRMQAMKTSVSRSFQTLDNRFRVGFTVISNTTGTANNPNFLPVNTFELAHKNTWFTYMFKGDPSISTPLRGALSKAGRYYGKKLAGQVDPIQYSCQQNFTILSTDGYWNTSSESGSYTALNLTGGAIGNRDGSAARPMLDIYNKSDTLADVAKYYYDTDLRTSALGNCTGATSTDFPAGNPDVCFNNVFVSSTDNNVNQHMTTFTMGLGIDGTLLFTTDYETATSGDYYDLENGLNSKNWPDPLPTENGTRIDDLWHAAVNGKGSYFSAKDPDSIIAGFSAALASISKKTGSGAAAASSTLNPVSGDNTSYVASYTTVRWTGNLEARDINTSTGVVSETSKWCVSNVVGGTCVSPSAAVAEVNADSTVTYCVTPGATLATCGSPGVLVGSDCKVEMSVLCNATLWALDDAQAIPPLIPPPVVRGTSDQRVIYTKGSSGSLVLFTPANLNLSDFPVGGLSQYLNTLTAAQKANATSTNLINYLRGQIGYEQRSSNAADKQVFRLRESVLGDAVESQPAFIGKPTFSYTEHDYEGFKSSQAGRQKVVYLGANDGMLHAFNATTGTELWAYVPKIVIPKLWQLADANYATQHIYTVNGRSTIWDVWNGSEWRTLLLGSLGGGGRGYFALDVTIPANPVLQWEFSSADDGDLGYSFGWPVATKKEDGTWVVLVSSGYNNTVPGDGKGYLYVLNAFTGAKISKISTGVGDTTTPSGLARFSAWATNPELDNSALSVYGGDLLGNLWRFDINNPGTAPFLFAKLKDSAGNPQPITTGPEFWDLGIDKRPGMGGKPEVRGVYIGTGKYLEASDLSDTQGQTFYVLKDYNYNDKDTASPTPTMNNPRTNPNMLVQTLASSGGSRSSSDIEVGGVYEKINDDYRHQYDGCFFNFPDSGERQHVESKIVPPVAIVVPTTVPTGSLCSPGGTGWLNFFNLTTCGSADPTKSHDVSVLTNAPIVGINLTTIGGEPIISTVTTDNPTPEVVQPPSELPSGAGSATDFVGKRMMWREVTPP